MSDSRESTEGAVPNAQSPAPGRRNLPRASQACQMCRIKKARCNQQQPCTNCRRHAFTCVYSGKGNGRIWPSRSRDVGTPGRPDDNSNGPHRARLRQNKRTSTIPELHSENDINLDNDITISRPDGLDLAKPTRAAFTSEDDPQHVNSEAAEGGLAQEDSNIVSDINKHTSGTEFYGTSSNFVLLNQLFSHARLHASSANFRAITRNRPTIQEQTSSHLEESRRPVREVTSGPRNSISDAKSTSHLGDSHLSIVNLLYNDEALLPPSRSKTPQEVDNGMRGALGSNLAVEQGSSRRNEKQMVPQEKVAATSPNTRPSLRPSHSSLLSNSLRRNRTSSRSAGQVNKIPQSTDLRLEKEYIRIFFNNIYHLHPMLLVDEFISRCQADVWNRNHATVPRGGRMHFLALYNIIIAVGALIAGPEPLRGFERELGVPFGTADVNPLALSKASLTLSKSYFHRSKLLLGDLFEVCSLESAQTLLYISLYCQNALKPHSCYMYSGMAVRTALAIGLPSESMSRSSAARRAARRTWWCIYSHEIDMCCSSGRRDSLMKPGNYLIPLPQIRNQNQETPEIEEHSMSMINEMVHFSVILRRASKEIYHDSKNLTLFEKSVIALELDVLLGNWRSNLPSWLNLDVKSLREPEWASKQKLVLQLRYLNARILLHRPFLASAASADFLQLDRNMEPCLDAARQTIDLLYESYEKRHYFRTWWYNSTYTLYAGMIILYIILLNYTKISGEELLRDVEKSREILLAMEEASVAQRSAKLIGEVLEVAKTYIGQRSGSSNPHLEHASFGLYGARDGQNTSDLDHYDFSAIDSSLDNDWSRTLFAHNLPGSSRGDILATLIDPTILQDFAAGGNDISNTRSVTSSMSVTGGGMGSGFYESPDQGSAVLGDSQFGETDNGAQWSLPWGTFNEPLQLQPGIW